MPRPYKSYSGDPRWISVKFPCSCVTCSSPIDRGERALYWPYNKSMNCELCGEPRYAQFQSEAADEYAMGGF